MRPATAWRTWARRVLGLGPSRLAVAVALLLVLASLALPFWSLGLAVGPGQVISSYSWTTVTSDRYQGGVWDGTTILPYTSSLFASRAVASTLGTAYLLVVALFVVLAVVLALFSLDFFRAMPTLSLLIVSLVVLGVGLSALFYPVVTVPGAATTDLGMFTIGGFWGSFSTSSPAMDWSWGPGLGWWVLLVAVVLGNVGAVLPYLKSIRAMVPPTRQAGQPSS